MAAPSGLDALIQYGVESSFASYETPDRRHEFTEESLSLTEERIESAARRTGSRVLASNRWKRNRKGIEGDVSHEVTSSGFGRLFEHCLGDVATDTPDGGTNSRTHTATIAALTGVSLTAQVGRPDTSGTIQPFSYLGCKVASWELSCDVDGILMLRLSFDGVDEDTSESLESVAAPTDDELLVFSGATVAIDGTDVDVRAFSLSGENGLATDRYFLRNSSLKKEQLEAERRLLSGSFEVDFEGMDNYELFSQGTMAEVTALFEAETEIESGFLPHVLVTLPEVRFDGTTPNVSSDEILTHEMPFTVLDNGSDEPITIEYQSEDTAA
jgi:hypothetical protein